jgi:hypothetical protein
MKDITPKPTLDGLRPGVRTQKADEETYMGTDADKNETPEDPKDEEEELDDLLEKGKDDFKTAESGWKDIRQSAMDDQSFYHGNQWEGSIKLLAQQRGEPVIEVNRLPTFVKQIENELRQREMAISVSASDEEGSEDTAEIFSGVIRGIEQRSNARAHYIHAAGENGALVPGFGFLKVEVDYETPTSFSQDISIRSIKDPMTIFPDPSSMQPDFSDAEYWFEVIDYPVPTFKKLFPFATANSLDYFSGGVRDDWVKDECIRVARYWYKKEKSTYHFLLNDGTMVTEQDVDDFDIDDDQDDDDQKRFAWVTDPKTKIKDRKVILRKRRVTESKIRWADMTGMEVLDEGAWDGSMFPFAAVTGPMSIVNGKRDIRGIIRFAKDSQKLLNYFASSAARRIASANKSPWLVAKESIVGHEEMWNNANRENLPYLLYNATNPNNQNGPNPPPQRADQTGQIQDLLAASAKYEDDLKATIGIYDAGLGATPNEQSGIAIQTLAQQGQNANFHFSDNLTTALKRVGAILVDLIPKIYDTARVVKTVGADNQERLVKINQLTQAKGENTVYDIQGAGGHYGVTVNVGPAYATAKQAAVEQMLELIRVNPNIAPFVQDIIATNMDFAGKEQVADRLQKVFAISNPQLVENQDQAKIPPQAQAQMAHQQQVIQQLSQQMQGLQAEAQKMQFILASKSADHQATIQKAQLDHQNTLQEIQAKAINDQQLAQMRAHNDQAGLDARLQMEHIKTQLDHHNSTLKVVMDAMKQQPMHHDKPLKIPTPPPTPHQPMPFQDPTTMPMAQVQGAINTQALPSGG